MPQNGALRTLTIINSLFMMAGLAIAPIYAVFLEGVGASVFMISLLTATLMAARLVTLVVVRFVGDALFEKEYLLIADYALRASAWGALIFIETIAPLFIVQAIVGISAGIGTPSFLAIFARHLDHGRQVSEYADYNISKFVFGIFGTVGGGWIVSTYSFDVLFAVMAVIGFFCAIYIALQPRKLL